ncbi:MAG: substrate-binding domain-containing protein [Lachnospiraceae bacterium]|nr:substrate-binding domain-containing protein [Lachnospiraceae bacterium]
MRKIIRKIMSTFLVAAMLVALSGCGRSEEADDPSREDEDSTIEIGMCFDSFVIERWQRDRDIFVQAAKDLGAEVNVQNANGDIEEQKKQIEYLIQKKVDAIVIVCIDSDSLADSVAHAKAAGIPVIAYDRMINNADLDLYISFDNEKVGTLMGESMIDAGLAGGKVIIIGGSPKDNNVSLVENGFTAVMEENGVEILDTTHCDGWRAELASEYVYGHTDLVEECDAIMCGNDSLAGQVVSALAVQMLAGKVLVTGQDADLEACQRIVEGTQLMTVYKPVETLARRAALCAVQLAKGESVTGYDVSGLSNGSYFVPYVRLEPVKVTRENMDEAVIGSGFHMKEDVYINVK